MPENKGFFESNIRYMYRFYELYSQLIENLPHGAEDSNHTNLLQGVEDFKAANLPQLSEKLFVEICSIPWNHQRSIIDKSKVDVKKALFFVRKVIENGWGRDVLLNFLGTDLYERQAKAITNFSKTLPALQSDLAQQTTKDPYVFNFLTMTEDYNEKELEDALVANVTKFLVELGTGFAYMGRQYRMQVGEKGIFIDLLFYNTRLHAYVCIELNTESFQAAHLGQLGLYVLAVNHQLRTEHDNPTIGLFICKVKDNIEAQYSLEAYNLPLGISQYELSKLIPTEIKSSLPSIEDIESSLEQLSENSTPNLSFHQPIDWFSLSGIYKARPKPSSG